MNTKEEKDSKELLIPKNTNQQSIGGIQEVKQYKLFGMDIDLPLIALCLLNFFLNAACSVITPFFPPLAEGNQITFPGDPLRVSSGVIGMIIGIHPIGGFLFGMVVSKFMMKLGRKNLMLWSLIVTVITLVMMGLCYQLTNYQGLFIATAMVARFFMGMARSGYGSTTFAYAPLLWPTQIPKMIGIMETCTGLGLMLGPIIGSGLFSIFKSPGLQYQMVFYILSGIFLIMIYPGISLLPQETKIVGKTQALGLGFVMKKPHILSVFFLLTCASFALTYVYPLWTNVMQYVYGVDASLASIYLTVGTLTYIASLLMMPPIIRITDKKFLLSLGLVLAIFATQLMAPATWIGLPRKDYIVIMGLFISGASQGFAILPFIPELRELIMQIYPDQKFIHMVGDMASGLFYAAYSFGTFLGPTVGGFIFDAYNASQSIKDQCGGNLDANQKCFFENSFMLLTNLMTYSTIFFLIIYLTFGKGYIGWQKLFSNKHKKQPLPTQKLGQINQQLLSQKVPTNNNQQPLQSTKEGLSDMIMTDSEAGEDFEFGKRAKPNQSTGKPLIGENNDDDDALQQSKKKKNEEEDEELVRNSRGSFIV